MKNKILVSLGVLVLFSVGFASYAEEAAKAPEAAPTSEVKDAPHPEELRRAKHQKRKEVSKRRGSRDMLRGHSSDH